MIEVFKTNVDNKASAANLIALLRINFGYAVNFDLEDCDRILRVECTTGPVDAVAIIQLLHKAGFTAYILEDIVAQQY